MSVIGRSDACFHVAHINPIYCRTKTVLRVGAGQILLLKTLTLIIIIMRILRNLDFIKTGESEENKASDKRKWYQCRRTRFSRCRSSCTTQSVQIITHLFCSIYINYIMFQCKFIRLVLKRLQ